MIDFQFVGAGRVGYELVYFMNTSYDPVSVEDDEALISAYHAALCASGVDEASYPLQQCLNEWHLALVEYAMQQCASIGGMLTAKMHDDLVKKPKMADLLGGLCIIMGRLFTRVPWSLIKLGMEPVTATGKM
jgi:hypothetical protein